MSIEAVITEVKKQPTGTIIKLGSLNGEGPGQSLLNILNATYNPTVGQIVWGDDSMVIIEPIKDTDPQHKYRRWGYTTLVEEWLK